jgi:hypothetical protein
MGTSRRIKRITATTAIVIVAFTGLLAAPAMAGKLSIQAARTKALFFAQRACFVDPYCRAKGISDIKRLTPHRVEVVIFNYRNTPRQGKYNCYKQLHISNRSGKPSILGKSKWRCN